VTGGRFPWRLRAVTLALVLLTGAASVEAQPAGRTGRVGFLYFGSRDTGLGAERYAAFLDGMRELGYSEGKNVVIEPRFADSKPERIPDLVQDLLRAKVDVIVATGSPAYRVLQRTTVPVVVTVTNDPVAVGLAATVARPGANFTGVTDTAADLNPKQLELLKAVVPRLARVGVLANPTNVSHPPQLMRLMLVAQQIGVHIVVAEASAVAQIDPAVAYLARERTDAVVLFGDTFFSQQLRQIADSALKQRMPSMYTLREYVEAGGLLGFGSPILDNFRRAATYVDKILKGANPAELPFEQPTRYLLSVNMKTAKQLGLAIPQSVLLRADRVVQ
jgi:putative ABC transport system substrate-binding protein